MVVCLGRCRSCVNTTGDDSVITLLSDLEHLTTLCLQRTMQCRKETDTARAAEVFFLKIDNNNQLPQRVVLCVPLTATLSEPEEFLAARSNLLSQPSRLGSSTQSAALPSQLRASLPLCKHTTSVGNHPPPRACEG